MEMTQQQKNHLHGLVDEFMVRLDKKYKAGVEEHGGFVGDVPMDDLFRHAEDEVLDQWVYIRTLRDKHAEITHQYHDRNEMLEDANRILRGQVQELLAHPGIPDGHYVNGQRIDVPQDGAQGWDRRASGGCTGGGVLIDRPHFVNANGVEQFAEAPRVAPDVSEPLPRSSFVTRVDAKMGTVTVAPVSVLTPNSGE